MNLTEHEPTSYGAGRGTGNDLSALGRSVSIERAQQLLGVSRRTIYYWIGAGKLATVRTLSGKSQRVLVESIWLQRRLTKGES